MLSDTEIIIMTRNRPEKLCRMIDSLLPFQNIIGRIWVSDNSTTIQTQIILGKNYPSIRSKKRDDLSVWDHYQIIAEEIKMPFCMILHDDDYALDTFISSIKIMEKKEYDLDACGFNGHFIINGRPESNIYQANTKDITLQKSNTIIENWIGGNHSHPPFPAFLYKSASLKKAFNTLKNLKESRVNDAILIYIISEFGKVGYCRNKILAYEIHEENDTHNININDWISLKNNYKILTGSKYDYGIMTIREKYLPGRLNYTKYPKSSSTIMRYKMRCIMKNPIRYLKNRDLKSLAKLLKIYLQREIIQKFTTPPNSLIITSAK